MRTNIILVGILIINCFAIRDGREWTLKKKENGIEVYTRESEGSKIKEVRVINTAKSTLAGVVALLLDTKNYPNWIYSCKEASALKVIGPAEIYKYQYTHAPAPVSDRDLVSDFKVSQNPKTKVVTITDVVMPDYIPEKKGVVRIKNFKASYTVSKLKDGMVKIEYQVFLDPGGDLPGWGVNADIIDVPYKNTVTMIKQLPKYQSSTYPFIKE